jgi:HNH endonuclease
MTHEGAHRYAWRSAYGRIPKGLYVCHHCDNGLCVRPDHLFLGTAADNNRDKALKNGTIRQLTAQIEQLRAALAAATANS